MLAALVIVFREVLEAGLIIGIVLAATKNVPRRGRWITLGIGLGISGACLIATCAGFIGELFHGTGQELLNAAVLFGAVGMLAWHNIWMSSHGREMAKDAVQLGVEVTEGRKKLGALTAVVAIAVLREGSEVVLFLYGLSASQGGSWQTLLLGSVLGLCFGAVSSAILYFGLLAIPVRHFFTATTALITFVASGLASQGVAFLQQGGYLDRWSAPLWDTSAWLPESGWIGRLLHTLIGYSDQPSGMQALAYVLTFSIIVILMRWRDLLPKN